MINLQQTSPTRRTAWTAVLLAALALAILAGAALAAATVKNGSFEKDVNGDKIPDDWTAVGFTPLDKRVCNQSQAGSCSVKEIGDGTAKELKQDIVIFGSAGDTVRLTFWAKGQALDAGPTHNVQINLNINHVDDSGEGLAELIPEGNSPWILYTLEFPVSEDFDSGQVYIYNDADGGKVWIDKVKVVVLP